MPTIIMMGRPTADLELKESPNGAAYVRFSLAVNKGYGDKQRALFFQCWLNGKEAERIVNAKVKKGSLISVAGDFDVDTYEVGGEKRASNKVNVLSWEYVPAGKPKTGDPDGVHNYSGDEACESFPESNIDDELPVM